LVRAVFVCGDIICYMENAKTLGHLNGKSWYRLLKVFYFSTIVIVSLASVIGVFVLNQPSENGNYYSYAQCKNGTTVDLEGNGIYSFNGYISSDDSNTIEQKCGISHTDTSANFQAGQRVPLSAFLQNNYQLVVSPTNWFLIITYSLITILVILAFFELLKRLFYYVILGSFRPKK